MQKDHFVAFSRNFPVVQRSRKLARKMSRIVVPKVGSEAEIGLVVDPILLHFFLRLPADVIPARLARLAPLRHPAGFRQSRRRQM